MTAREASSLGMHDVGLACLSPGFQTHDPSMREQLQKSISVRNQQQHIIESRLQRTVKGPGDSSGPGPSADRPDSSATFGSGTGGGLKTPMTSKKRAPPPGLSIVPPSAEQFANERVIQSAPLHQTFTGRHQPPHTRHTAHGPGAAHTPGQSSHIHQVPAMQTANRLPPIADVFPGDGLGIGNGGGSGGRDAPGGQTSGGNGNGNGASARPGFYHSNSASNLSSHSNHRQGFPSPGLPPPSSSHHHAPPSRDQHPSAGPGPSRDYPPQQSHQQQQHHAPPQHQPSQHPQAPGSTRPQQREYRSAEEAVAEMASGREELLPKLVHYGGHQPPTPPSPPSGGHHGAHHHLHHHHGGHPVAVAGPDRPPAQHHPSGLTPNKHALASGAGGAPGSGGLERSASGARRRGRMEYERDNGSPPLGSGPSPRIRPGPFGEGRDTPETQRRKKAQFIDLCAQAWDLFHS